MTPPDQTELGVSRAGFRHETRPVRVNGVAFYLPQFHPIPENDAWWGPGFTEWTNVTRARPRFRGHQQPHLPSDLGFYDLRVPEARAAQAELAREAGLQAFCYYHYWFNGRRLLERPFDDVRRAGEPTLPFMLMWANENWTRRWDGQHSEVLLEQTYAPDDDLAHIRWLCDAFADPRYFRVDGRPVLIVYRPHDLPDAKRTTDAWRSEASRLGIGELYLCKVNRQESDRLHPHDALGFDASIDWIPNFDELGLPLRWSRPWGLTRRLGVTARGYGANRVWDYGAVARQLASTLPPTERDGVHYPCVTVSWDNSARRPTNACILRGAEPALYEAWLRAAKASVLATGAPGGLVFINAWNEWAEGNHLEPCQRWGREYLDATARVLLSPDAA